LRDMLSAQSKTKARLEPLIKGNEKSCRAGRKNSAPTNRGHQRCGTEGERKRGRGKLLANIIPQQGRNFHMWRARMKGGGEVPPGGAPAKNVSGLEEKQMALYHTFDFKGRKRKGRTPGKWGGGWKREGGSRPTLWGGGDQPCLPTAT